MKNLIVILALLGIVGLSSCKRDWVCQCVAANNTSVTNTPINGGTFLHAQHTCHSMGSGCSLLTEGN